jgi:hypothetical protein
LVISRASISPLALTFSRQAKALWHPLEKARHQVIPNQYSDVTHYCWMRIAAQQWQRLHPVILCALMTTSVRTAHREN